MQKGVRTIVYFAVAFVVIMGLIVFMNGNNPPANVQQTNNTGNSQVAESFSISVSELSEHNTEDDCWVGYDGKVYDITDWLPVHPGSAAAISPYCGTSEEFTSAFEGKHGTFQVSKLMEEGIYLGDLE